MKTFVKILIGLFFALLFVTFAPVRPVIGATIEIPCGDPPALAEAINTANADPFPDTIKLVDGCWYALLDADNSSPEFGPNGLPVITSKIIIQGGGIDRPSGGPAFRFFFVAPSGNLVLKGVSLRFGNPGVNESTQAGYHGGAIYNNQGKLKVKFGRFIKNSVVGEPKGDGGVIYNDRGTVTWMGGSTVWSFANRGAVLFNSSGGVLNMWRGDLWRSFADTGAGIYNEGDVNLQNTTIRIADAVKGGAIANYGTATVNASRFFGNGAYRHDTHQAGGILNFGPLVITNSTFEGNHARTGGAIVNEDSALIANTTFYWNETVRNGGAILNRARVELINVTLADNHAGPQSGIGEGGSIYTAAGAITTFANSIITRGTPQNCIGNIQDVGGNLRFPESDHTCVGKHGDPMLAAWQKYGGLVQTMPPQPGSAAINNAIKNICLAAPVNNQDARGVTRIRTGETNCDSGAHEAR
jgi:hypothetical protein